MKKNFALFATVAALGMTACTEAPKENWTDCVLDVAACQLKQTAIELTDSTAMPMPRMWIF